jgi:uncharacterized membrane protein
MFELLAGTGLSAAAGLNAYIPLLALGLAGRFLTFVHLPAAWNWLTSDWALIILAVLLVVEVIADKIPVVDSVNDVVQTVVRPVAGGIVFGAGTTTSTAAVTDPATVFSSLQVVWIIFGIFVALAVHVLKASARPVINAASFGLAAPAVSVGEDASSLLLTLSAIFLPILVIFALGGVIVGFVYLFGRGKRRRTADESKRLQRARYGRAKPIPRPRAEE